MLTAKCQEKIIHKLMQFVTFDYFISLKTRGNKTNIALSEIHYTGKHICLVAIKCTTIVYCTIRQIFAHVLIF